MGEPARKLEQRHTYRDYLGWPEDERWELIEGIAYQMSGPNRRHQAIVGECYLLLRQVLEGKPCKVYVAPFDVLLPELGEEEDGEVSNVVEPDLVVFCDRSKLTAAGARGAPDIAIEVISPSNTVLALRKKYDLYERMGVREYWIIDPAGQWIKRFDRGEEGRYGEPEARDPVFTKGAIPSLVLEGFTVEPEELFAAE